MTRLAAFGRWPAIGLALLAGALCALGFAPIASIAGPVAGSALAILLLAAQPRRRAFALGLAYGFAQAALGLTWIAHAFTFQAAMPAFFGWLAVLLLALYLGLYPALAALVARRLSQRIVPLALLFAGLFTITEMLRGLLLTGFAWNPLGVAWLQLAGVAQLAAIIGANGLSALAILAGGSLAALVGARAEPGRRALVFVFPLLLGLGLAVPRIQQPLPPAPGPTLLLVQTGVGIDEKYADDGAEESLAAAVIATRRALATGAPPAAVIWPEAAVPWPFSESPGLAPALVRGFAPATLLLTGGVELVHGADGQVVAATNSLFAIDAKGVIRARYDKAHLVPGGEYLPLRAIAEPLGLARLVPGSLDFRPGPGPRTLHLPGLPAVGPDICYEIIFPGAVVARADRPAFILTISNDGWFGPSGPPQHFAQARLRAIEEGLPVMRDTPTGISGVIDARGGIVATLPRGKAATARIALPAALPPTPFARIGLLAPLGFALLLLAMGAGALLRHS